MIDFEFAELNRCDGWKSVLAAYDALKKHHADSDGWLSRIGRVDGVEFEDLPRIHGKLISLGLLKFQLADRTMGMRYMLSGLGKRALAKSTVGSADTDSDPESSVQAAIELA